MEVLLRMIQPDGTMAPPAVFLPAAERFNLMPRLDRWVMRKSLIWLEQAAQSLGIDRVSVNLSGQSLGDPVFQDWLLRELGDKSPSLCNRLIIEITETVAIARTNDASPFFKKLRDMGVAVALDDFGSGTASFAYLKTLSIDYLKIDGQFIKNLCSNQLDEATVRAFVGVAKVIGVKTVAEFVETQEIFDKLHAMGVDYAQGYLVHRPQQLKTFLKVVTKHKAN